MNILWVKAGGLVPPDTGGKIRSYNILRQLARDHRVTLVLFSSPQENALQTELASIFQRVITVPLDLPPPRKTAELLDYLRGLFSREPYSLTKYCLPAVKAKLRALLQEQRFDVLLCDFLVTAGVIPWDWAGPKVLFAHNVEALIWLRHLQIANNPLWKAVSWWEAQRMNWAERRYLQMADHVIAVSENDRKIFGGFLNPQKVSVVQTGVDTELFQPRAAEQIPDSLVFTGSMDWLPNEDAIIYFAGEILPLITRQLPDVTLTVVGRKPSARLQNLAAKRPEIRLTGWVEDVRPYIAQAAVYVVPLRIGGGTRLKIFEAMSMAKPVVSTSIGAEGLPVVDGEHLLLADEPAIFADTVVALLKDSARCRQIGQAARLLVEQNFSWATVTNGFAGILEQAVKRRTHRD